jgi:tetratricopeptide (TPR) repeat protein
MIFPGRSPSRWWACGLLALGALAFGPSARAALPADANEPYALTIVLAVAPHPSLTAVFREQLQRELRDSLQAAFGKLAKVAVVTQHPLLPEIARRGLPAALDGFKDEGNGKLHFVVLDHVHGRFDLQSAQYDGRTGLTTPVIRHAVLDDPADRPLVARTAALQIDLDFGIIGTVIDASNPARVRVELQGHALGESLDRWARKDDVFAIAQVNRGGPQRTPDAYLQVIDGPKAGICTCRLLARYADAASRLNEGPGTQGYRCLRLGTTEGPLRLRVIDDKGAGQTGVRVLVSALGFDPLKDDFKPVGVPDRDGLVRPERPFRNIAFVRMMATGAAVAQVPVPIIAGQTAVCRVNVEPGNELIGQVTLHRQRYLERLNEALQLQANLRVVLNDLMAKSKPEQALTQGRASLAEQLVEWKNLKEELDSLRKELSDSALPASARSRLRVDTVEQRLAQIESGSQSVKEFLDQVEKVLKDRPKQKLVEGMVLRARLLKNEEARYDKALEIYADALSKAIDADKPEIDAEMQRLKTDWALREPIEAHRKARQVLYEVLPQAGSLEQLQDALDQAPGALEVCRKCGDRLTPRRLLAAATLPALVRLLDRERNGLRADTEDGRQRLKAIGDASDRLEKLVRDVTEYLKSTAPAKPASEKAPG